MTDAVLTVSRCAAHGYYAVIVERGGHGHRLSSSKCCGQWGAVRDWCITSQQLRDVADWLDSPDFPIALENGARRPSASEAVTDEDIGGVA